ncbi:hypothetical protein BHF68_04125 [Desulfuribacillus alkaliarsenatis]|uniref:Sodium-dependent bicarbonate transport family permease n=2 Tax=Desulfuribacillus alkaliarsenatis TaxID=766136 RepID=A0A1E5G3L7_9FIRM|nr:hypothetical protein BHF68_04125 [Desulfuribacillus alkaliarsenatis]
MIDLAISNLISPVVLFFAMGLVIALIKAKVEFPNAIGDFITMYLLVAIGLKGGVAIAEAGILSVLPAIIGATVLGIFIPIYCFYILKGMGKFKADDAAALAGHYGSISVVTFIAAATFLTNQNIEYEAFMNGLPAIMEIPAIIVALVLASLAKGRSFKKASTVNSETGADKLDALSEKKSLPQVTKQVVLSKSVILLLGAMIVGYITGPSGMVQVEFFYKELFMGMLSLFMLEMGIVAGSKIHELRKAGVFIVGFGIIIPCINAVLGIIVGGIAGLSIGGATLLGVLAASCSYIVAPAAMRVSLPKANPAMYLGASLGVTLPFNLIFGIPIYYYLATNIMRFF